MDSGTPPPLSSPLIRCICKKHVFHQSRNVFGFCARGRSHIFWFAGMVRAAGVSEVSFFLLLHQGASERTCVRDCHGPK